MKTISKIVANGLYSIASFFDKHSQVAVREGAFKTRNSSVEGISTIWRDLRDSQRQQHSNTLSRGVGNTEQLTKVSGLFERSHVSTLKNGSVTP